MVLIRHVLYGAKPHDLFPLEAVQSKEVFSKGFLLRAENLYKYAFNQAETA
jgi:hypothetical protein